MSSKFAPPIAKLLVLLLVLHMLATAAVATETRTLTRQNYNASLTAPSASQNTKQPVLARIALLIGNTDYPQKPLLSPVRDAQAMAAKLTKLGFHVIKRENTSTRAMRQALDEFGALLQATKGVGLFYYAGHGIQVEGINYLMPVDIDLRDAQQIQQRSLSLNQVLDQVGQARNQTNILVVDACRDNPFPKHSGLAPLSYANTPGNTFISFATSPGNVAIDGDDNGLFTEHLLNHLDKPDLPIEQLFKQVRQDVMQATQNFQIPWEHSSLTGDFYFNPPNLAAVAAASSNAVSQSPDIAKTQNAPVNETADSQLLRVSIDQLRLGPALSKVTVPAKQTLTSAKTADNKAAQIDRYLDSARVYLLQTDLIRASQYLDKAFALSDHATPEQIETLANLIDAYALKL